MITTLSTEKLTMTSLQIAEIVNKPHNDVMKAIRKMEPAWEKVSEGKFSLTSYQQPQPNGGYKEQPCYSLTQEECLYIATKFNDEARAKLIKRWKELEQKEHKQMLALPQNFSEALRMLADKVEQNEQQQKVISEQTKVISDMTNTITDMQQRLSYTDQILASRSTMTVTGIAQDYGMSAKKFNAILHDAGIQRKVNGQWVLYGPYLQGGYVQSKTITFLRKDGSPDTTLNTEWTQKGRLFLYQKLRNRGILPLIEQPTII